MSNTSTVHIKTDFDCIVYNYGQELGTTKADTYFNIELRKGEHELMFVFFEDNTITKTINYTVEDADCEYKLVVEIAEVIYDKAFKSLRSRNFVTAFSLFLIAAEHGYPKAQDQIGNSYDLTRTTWDGIEKDQDKAIEWYTKAAEQGLAEAQYDLGYCYLYGKIDQIDISKAISWFIKAAEQGYDYAHFCLGDCYHIIGNRYEFGNGVDKNSSLAVEHYLQAVEEYEKTSISSSQFSERNWNPYYMLGKHYENGDGVGKDFSKALYYYIKAAEKYQIDAILKVAKCYYYGEWVEKDYKKACEWFDKAAVLKNPTAEFYLGFCYDNGQGVEKDHFKAIEWYTKAANHGEGAAQCNLGNIYNFGRGVEKTMQKL